MNKEQFLLSLTREAQEVYTRYKWNYRYQKQTGLYRDGLRRGFLNQPWKDSTVMSDFSKNPCNNLLESDYESKRKYYIDEYIKAMPQFKEAFSILKESTREQASPLLESWWGITPRQASPLYLLGALQDISCSDTWSYTNEYGRTELRESFAKVMNERSRSAIFTHKDIMLTLWGTEALSLLTSYVKDKEKDLLILGQWYFKTYDQEWLEIKTLFNENMDQENELRTFRTLPNSNEIKMYVKDKSIWAMIITYPWMAGEKYSGVEIREIIWMAAENNIKIFIDWAFEGLWQSDLSRYQNILNRDNKEEAKIDDDFLSIATEMGQLENIVYFTSLSKSEWLSSPKFWFLAATDTSITEYLSKVWWEYRDGLNINNNLATIDAFVKLVKAKINNAWEVNLESIVIQAMNEFGEDKLKSLPISPATINVYFQQKRDDLSAYKFGFEYIKSQTGKWLISTVSWGDAYFNCLVKLDKYLPTGFEFDDFVRLSFLGNWSILAPWPNFGETENFWKNRPLFLRVTTTSCQGYLTKCLLGIDEILQKMN